MVDVGLYEPVLRVLDDAIAVYGGTGQVRERIGSGTESVVPHNHYRTRDGRWIAIACTNDRMFTRLLEAHGAARPDGRSAYGNDRGPAGPPRAGGRARRGLGGRPRPGSAPRPRWSGPRCRRRR